MQLRVHRIDLVGETPRLPWIRLAAVAAIAGGGLLAFLLVRLSGGSPSPLNHLGYLPIVLAAYLFGPRGGLAAALYVAIVLGPLASGAHLAGGLEGPDAWAIRAITFGLVGGLTGYLFGRARQAMLGWRSAALETRRRQLDGMVALARGAEAKDTDTGDHVVRVQLLAQELARAAGQDRERAADIGWSAMCCRPR